MARVAVSMKRRDSKQLDETAFEKGRNRKEKDGRNLSSFSHIHFYFSQKGSYLKCTQLFCGSFLSLLHSHVKSLALVFQEHKDLKLGVRAGNNKLLEEDVSRNILN